MKIIDKITLVIFSVFIIIFSALYITLFYNLIDLEVVANFFEFCLLGEPNRSVFLVISIVCAILSLRVLFIDSDEKKPISIKNENGMLEIMPITMENIAKITTDNYASIENVTAKMRNKKDGIIINLTCYVLPNTNITDITLDLQNKIKEKIEKQTSANVLNVNIKVKDIKKIKEE